ncbi:MAG: hypothetical protein C0595_05450 [Marinilabiliales bacterium]|nr:MAG: hypothetical protein C0595_05450 [Marinilabiliales bacterium]
MKAKTISYYIKKSLMSFMTLAFFYLVIGDLIIIHQKKIWKLDVYAGQPILKPNKSDKEKYLSLKGKTNNQIHELITFVSAVSDFNKSLECQIFVDYLPIVAPTQGLLEITRSATSLRGPPIVIC